MEINSSLQAYIIHISHSYSNEKVKIIENSFA